MAYDRYDENRRSRNARTSYSAGYDRGPNSYDRSPRSYDRSERDFFDRASDEVMSWFGDDDAERRREMDHRYDDRSPRFREEGYRRPYTGRSMSRFSAQNDWDRGDTQAGYSERWSIRADNRDDYSQWRDREVSSLDRDYDEFRRERQQRFEDEFGNWRKERMTKREMLRTLQPHMEVVGNDGEHIGTVDKVRGDNVILTKNDSEDGRHHRVPCNMLDKVEDGKLMLNKSCEEAKSHLQDSRHERFLFEDRNEEASAPHMLNRSFSGTY